MNSKKEAVNLIEKKLAGKTFLSYKEIAAITDASQDAVKQQISRGRERLRAILKIEN